MAQHAVAQRVERSVRQHGGAPCGAAVCCMQHVVCRDAAVQRATCSMRHVARSAAAVQPCRGAACSVWQCKGAVVRCAACRVQPCSVAACGSAVVRHGTSRCIGASPHGVPLHPRHGRIPPCQPPPSITADPPVLSQTMRENRPFQESHFVVYTKEFGC